MVERRVRARARIASARVHAPLLALFGWLWLAGTAGADPASASLKGRCEIQFFGSSTLHDFSGESPAREFALEPRVDAASGIAGWGGAIEVAVAEMDTGIDRRDRNMRDMFAADRYPLIVASFPNVESALLDAARRGDEPNVDFELKIRDVERPVAAKISHWTEEGQTASFDAEFELSLESFGLAVPPVLGLLRVGDVVAVRAHVTLDELPANAGAGAANGRPSGSSSSDS